MKKCYLLIVIVFLILSCANETGKPLATMSKARQRAIQTAIQATLRQLDMTVQMYYAEHMKYPESIEDLRSHLRGIGLKAPDGGTYEYDAKEHKFLHRKKSD